MPAKSRRCFFFLARVSRQVGNSQKMALLPNGLKLGCPPTGSYGSALRGSKLSGPTHQGKPLIPLFFI